MNWPTIVYNEEIMREGFGIEDVRIPLSAKVDFLDALSESGLKRITVGAFVSPRFVPQMANFKELLQNFHPKKGVTYLPFIHNQKAKKLAEQYSPPLTIEEELCTLFIDICDVHQRRNVNRSIKQIEAFWPEMIREAKSRGIGKGRIAIASAYGSNFLGKFPQSWRFSFLERQIALLQEAGMSVVEIGLHDLQSWCVPHEIEEDIREIKRRWPAVKQFHLHIHDARGMALPALYAALRTLDASDTVLVDGTLGGIGGGQYCGNGRASGMAATEDFLHMLEGMGLKPASISASSSTASGCWRRSSAVPPSVMCPRRVQGRPIQRIFTIRTCRRSKAWTRRSTSSSGRKLTKRKVIRLGRSLSQGRSIKTFSKA